MEIRNVYSLILKFNSPYACEIRILLLISGKFTIRKAKIIIKE
jgi:hypothetical protein